MPLNIRKRSLAQGVSLAETLIVVGLVGLLLLPVLLTSTTYFSGQMLKMRQRLGLAHNVSLLLSQMINHFGSTSQLITSTSQETFTAADELHYTFYDPVKATQIYGGFKLTTLGGGRRKLEALTYSSGSWSAISPYRTSVATAYTVPGAAVFDYCNPDACGKTPDQATFVRLSGWTFRDETATSRTFALPTTDIYLNSRRATEGKLTGQKARLLYSTTPTQAFGATGNLEVLALSPARKTLWMPPDAPGSGGAGNIAPGLITIIDGGLSVGYYSTLIDETRGNAFLFDYDGGLYQWNSLMTTAALRQSSSVSSGQDASIVSPYTGRVYFGCNDDSNCSIRYYDPGTNAFSTISASNKLDFGGDALIADPGRKVIYAGWRNSSNDTGLLMYNEDTGTTTTLLSMTSGSNNDIRETLSLNPTTGRLYFAFRKSNGPLWSWTPTSSGGNYTTGTLLSIGSGLVSLGRLNSIQALPVATNRVLFGDNAGIYTWKDGDVGVTTIRTGASSTPMQAADYWPGAMRSIHNFNFRYDTGRDIAYWYEAGTNSGVYAYDFGSSTLRTLTPTVGKGSGKNSLWLDSSTGKLYWGNSAASDKNVYQWTPGTNTLITLFTGGTAGSGSNNAMFTSVDSSKLFVGHSSTARSANVYNLSTSSLTTLSGTDPSAGSGCSIQDPVTGRIIFCAVAGAFTNSLFTWDATGGLTSLLSGYSDSPLYGGGALGVDSVRKYVVIGTIQDPDPVYVYSYASGASSSGSSIRKATAQGQPSGLLTLTPNSGTLTYKASEVDSSRNVYLVNTTNNTIDRYTYSSGTSTYNLGGTMTSSATVINATTAMVIDPNTAGFSILNGSTKKVYVFSDRSTTGAISPASNFNVTEATTPTGLALDRRNGDYYVVDSTVSSSAIKVRRYTSAGVYKGTGYDLTIDVSAASLGTSAATGETKFKIRLDELRNILYLAAPTLNRLYVLSIPEPAA